jgi:hypothetical protein
LPAWEQGFTAITVLTDIVFAKNITFTNASLESSMVQGVAAITTESKTYAPSDRDSFISTASSECRLKMNAIIAYHNATVVIGQ